MRPCTTPSPRAAAEERRAAQRLGRDAHALAGSAGRCDQPVDVGLEGVEVDERRRQPLTRERAAIARPSLSIDRHRERAYRERPIRGRF
jgi:hypothetical protein